MANADFSGRLERNPPYTTGACSCTKCRCTPCRCNRKSDASSPAAPAQAGGQQEASLPTEPREPTRQNGAAGPA